MKSIESRLKTIETMQNSMKKITDVYILEGDDLDPPPARRGHNRVVIDLRDEPNQDHRKEPSPALATV